MKNIKLLVSDIDGVWTDGSFYYTEEGDSLRKFNTKDSFGVALARFSDLPILILSGEENAMVRKRMEKLGVDTVELGVKNKLDFLKDHCLKQNISLTEVAFVGDDMNDFKLLGQVGFFACPVNSYPRIKSEADMVLKTEGGKGAFREFVEFILNEKGLLDASYEKYIAEQ